MHIYSIIFVSSNPRFCLYRHPLYLKTYIYPKLSSILKLYKNTVI
nr:MAG TPA: hypothetical protein [Caudoviricetes sp.]